MIFELANYSNDKWIICPEIMGRFKKFHWFLLFDRKYFAHLSVSEKAKKLKVTPSEYIRLKNQFGLGPGGEFEHIKFIDNGGFNEEI